MALHRRITRYLERRIIAIISLGLPSALNPHPRRLGSPRLRSSSSRKSGESECRGTGHPQRCSSDLLHGLEQLVLAARSIDEEEDEAEGQHAREAGEHAPGVGADVDARRDLAYLHGVGPRVDLDGEAARALVRGYSHEVLGAREQADLREVRVGDLVAHEAAGFRLPGHDERLLGHLALVALVLGVYGGRLGVLLDLVALLLLAAEEEPPEDLLGDGLLLVLVPPLEHLLAVLLEEELPDPVVELLLLDDLLARELRVHVLPGDGGLVERALLESVEGGEPLLPAEVRDATVFNYGDDPLVLAEARGYAYSWVVVEDLPLLVGLAHQHGHVVLGEVDGRLVRGWKHRRQVLLDHLALPVLAGGLAGRTLLADKEQPDVSRLHLCVAIHVYKCGGLLGAISR